jgi:hypothetical protein
MYTLAAKKLEQRKEQEENKSEKRPRRTIGELKEELLAIMQSGELISASSYRKASAPISDGDNDDDRGEDDGDRASSHFKLYC